MFLYLRCCQFCARVSYCEFSVKSILLVILSARRPRPCSVSPTVAFVRLCSESSSVGSTLAALRSIVYLGHNDNWKASQSLRVDMVHRKFHTINCTGRGWNSKWGGLPFAKFPWQPLERRLYQSKGSLDCIPGPPGVWEQGLSLSIPRRSVHGWSLINLHTL